MWIFFILSQEANHVFPSFTFIGGFVCNAHCSTDTSTYLFNSLPLSFIALLHLYIFTAIKKKIPKWQFIFSFTLESFYFQSFNLSTYLVQYVLCLFGMWIIASIQQDHFIKYHLFMTRPSIGASTYRHSIYTRLHESGLLTQCTRLGETG